MKLRPYQEELINRVYQSWESGNKNVLLQLPTGGGKSILFSTIVVQKAFGADRLPTAIMVHRKELVQQISLTLSSLGIMHNIIAPKITITGIIAAQRKRYGKSFYDFKSHVSVISVDTLNSRILKHKDWVKSIKLWITDEAAHLLASNKWGKAVSYFSECIGLGVTATPQRLDKKGLGSHADGVFDHMVVGPGSRWLIQNNFLSRYKIVAPESDIANYLAKPSDRADYTRENMAEAAGKSQIVGDVVTNYLKFAPGKQAILFATDINTAKKMEENFNDKGIPAKLLTGMSSDRERFEGIIDFEEKRTKVLVNVDLFDEGLDCPNIEVVIMARPTMSLGKYLQCVGRGLRPHPDKEYTLLIDHVGNVVRHGLPCSPRKWTLDRVERRKSNKSMIRICSNVDCAAPYERELKECPWCGTPAIVMERGGRVPPEMVDGDLTLIDPESLIEMNSLTQLEDPARLAERVAHVAGGIAGQRALKNQVQRIEVQKELAEIIARWAGEQKIDGLSDREIHKRYYLNFGETIAQSLSKPRSEMLEVVERLQQLTSNKEVQATARQMPMPSGLKPDL